MTGREVAFVQHFWYFKPQDLATSDAYEFYWYDPDSGQTQSPRTVSISEAQNRVVTLTAPVNRTGAFTPPATRFAHRGPTGSRAEWLIRTRNEKGNEKERQS